ncbi:MAG: hypothetical protein ACI91B_002490 [Planctomycetota bacterium]
MNSSAVSLKALSERVLKADGTLPLELLLLHLAPVEQLRKIAQKLGLSPKGGFRIERAPAKILAPLLAEQRDAKRLEDVVSLLLPKPPEPPPPEAQQMQADAEAVSEARALLALREADVVRLKDELERSRESQARARAREAELERQLSATQEELAHERRATHDAKKLASTTQVSRDDKELQHRLHELEAEREGFLAADAETRRQSARDSSRRRELEDEVAELESLIPASRRRKKRPMLPEPATERRILVPHFLPSFYKSLEGKERRSIERAIQAILLFCTEGHAYPGLEVKHLGGQDTWSLRASLGLRVYFRPLTDGDIEVLELGDREDQNTTLRRLKEK